MTWVREKFRYQVGARKIEPCARLTTKDGAGWTALWVVGVVLTLGLLAWKMPLSTWRENVATTVGPWQGYPARYTELDRVLVAHESRHTAQCVALGWALAPLVLPIFSRTARAVAGLPLFAVLYFLLLPAGLAFGRFFLELDADRASWRLGLREDWLTSGDVLVRAGQRAESLSRGIYLYAWPRSGANERYERMAREIVHEATR